MSVVTVSSVEADRCERDERGHRIRHRGLPLPSTRAVTVSSAEAARCRPQRDCTVAAERHIRPTADTSSSLNAALDATKYLVRTRRYLGSTLELCECH
jgi:hypothetical protein